jgi:hypothetical protein
VLPGISVVINVYLMMMLSVETWIRFGVWMAIGKFVFTTTISYNTPYQITSYHNSTGKQFSTVHMFTRKDAQTKVEHVIK